MRGWLPVVATLAVSLLPAAQHDPSAPLDRDVLLLARIKVVAQENLLRQPNYTCLQTIERSRRRRPKGRFELVDTIRLEVALIDGKELFSWPGAGKFEDRRISDIVGGGTIGNGNFALHARSVFLGNAATFEKDDEHEVDGRRLVRFRFQVPRFRSGFQIRVGELQGIAGYYGSFDVDATTLDLMRLEVNATEIPTHLPILSTRDVMHYARVRIGDTDFLLPESSELTMVSLDGTENRNRVHFSSCRQYAGESVLTFDDAPPLEALPPPTHPVSTVELEGGVDLDLRLETHVRFGASAVGDEVLARLARDARQHGRILVPKDTLVRGRLTRLERRRGARETILVATLEFSQIELPDRLIPLDAVLVRPPQAVRAGIVRAGVEDNTLYLNRSDIPQGFRMLWRTQAPSR